jgi:Leucine-rich repeat (LRR) protein
MQKSSIIIAFLLIIVLTNVVKATPPNQTEEEGQVYIVQADDWLSKLADRFYRDPFAWPIIQQTTNVKSMEDSSFTFIDNPDLLEVGQKLWIPAKHILIRQKFEALAKENIVELNISGSYNTDNVLIKLPPEIGQLSTLTLLDASFNELTRLPPEIGQLSNLLTLRVGWNHLEILPDEIGQLSKLENLDLGENRLGG